MGGFPEFVVEFWWPFWGKGGSPKSCRQKSEDKFPQCVGLRFRKFPNQTVFFLLLPIIKDNDHLVKHVLKPSALSQSRVSAPSAFEKQVSTEATMVLIYSYSRIYVIINLCIVCVSCVSFICVCCLVI